MWNKQNTSRDTVLSFTYNSPDSGTSNNLDFVLLPTNLLPSEV